MKCDGRWDLNCRSLDTVQFLLQQPWAENTCLSLAMQVCCHDETASREQA